MEVSDNRSDDEVEIETEEKTKEEEKSLTWKDLVSYHVCT